VLKLVSLPVWHSLSPGRLQLELAAQPALAKRWKALLKKEAKAAKAAAAAAAKAQEGGGGGGGGTALAAAAAAAQGEQQARAEASFIPGLLLEFLAVLREADEALLGQQQRAAAQAQGRAGMSAVAAAAAAAVAAAAADDESDGDDGQEEEAAAVAEEQQGDAAAGGCAGEQQADAGADAQTNGHATGDPAAATAAAAGRHGRQRGPRALGRRVLLHLERFVEFFIDLLSQLPTRRFVHALVEDQQLLVKVRGAWRRAARRCWRWRVAGVGRRCGCCQRCRHVSHTRLRRALTSPHVPRATHARLHHRAPHHATHAGAAQRAVRVPAAGPPLPAAAGPAGLLLRLPHGRPHGRAAEGGRRDRAPL
jgi:hypothetical protein